MFQLFLHYYPKEKLPYLDMQLFVAFLFILKYFLKSVYLILFTNLVSLIHDYMLLVFMLVIDDKIILINLLFVYKPNHIFRYLKCTGSFFFFCISNLIILRSDLE